MMATNISKLNTDCKVNVHYEENIIHEANDILASSITQSQLIVESSQPIIHESNSDNTIKEINSLRDRTNNLNKDIKNCDYNNESVTPTRKMSVKHIEIYDEKILDYQYNQSPPQSSKLKLKCTKRRAGILYKKLTNLKASRVTSGYFNRTKNMQEQWIPPRSPYALVQEDLFDKPWQLLVATVFLTKTSAKRALPQLHKFLDRFPLPKDVLQANYADIDEYFKPMGLTTTRSHIIMRFTVEFLEKDWTYPRELYGIGKYGDDSYRMFCINEWRQVSPDDIPLTMYRNWLLENADRLGIT